MTGTGSKVDETIRITLRQQADYRFEAHFEGTEIDPLQTDEPPPLGGGTGPNPTLLLGTAVANCLAASLLFTLRKFGNDTGQMQATCTLAPERNAQGRWRIPRIDVDLQLGVPWMDLKHATRALSQFEDFCVVTQSVRGGIDIHVRVVDSTGAAPAAVE
jgi:organic hydroperoxide reductase OsmC/OhrA